MKAKWFDAELWERTNREVDAKIAKIYEKLIWKVILDALQTKQSSVSCGLPKPN
jgi:hypothetical protein